MSKIISLIRLNLLTISFLVTSLSLVAVAVVNNLESDPVLTFNVKFESSEQLEGPYKSINQTDPVFDFNELIPPNTSPIEAFIKVSNVGVANLAYRISFNVTKDTLAPAVIFEIRHVGDNGFNTYTGEDISMVNIVGVELLSNAFDIYQVILSLDALVLTNEFNLDADDPRFPLSFSFDIVLFVFEVV